MSFSSFSAGTGTSAGAAVYPLRILVRDAIERFIRLELSKWLDRPMSSPDKDVPDPHGNEARIQERERLGDDLRIWLSSDDSPLLVQNIPDYVTDPAGSLRNISERVEGSRKAIGFVAGEIAGVSSSHHAMELQARMRTFAELDAERSSQCRAVVGHPKGRREPTMSG
jgi:hypothetical protein